MAALPYMPLYVADYLADAAHLSTLGHGAYLLLIMTYWQRGEALPDDERKLARIARMTDAEWQDVRDDLREFFDIAEGEWRHSRIEQELEKVRAKSKASSEAGKASAKRRMNKRSTPVEQTFNHTDTDTDIPPENTTCSRPPKGEAKRTQGRKLPEDWQPKESHFELGSSLGFSAQAVRNAADAMRDWARSNEHRAIGKKSCWDKTFNNWLRNNVPKGHAARDGPPRRNLTDAAIDINRWMSPDAEPDTSRDQYALPSPDRW